jgi:pimeloyl-ACP methyl ester carboxylesterase
MDIILVPGFWLDASSWSQVTPQLTAAGHHVHPLTLPGLEAVDAPRSGIGLNDHIDAVVAAVDAVDAPVILVGHSGGGGIIHGAVDRRPQRVARSIYVDSFPLGEGGAINDELPADGDDVPLPPWDGFDEPDLVDLTDELRDGFRARAIPEPRRVTSDQQHLTDERRFDVPVTVIACEFSADQIRRWVGAGEVPELAKIRDVEYVELPTGHWPQFTKPVELGAAIRAAVERTA